MSKQAQYQLVCFSYDGEYIRDFKADTVDEVKEFAANMGSRWFFYPIETIAKCTKRDETDRIVDKITLMGIELFPKNCMIKTVSNYLSKCYRRIILLPPPNDNRTPCEVYAMISKEQALTEQFFHDSEHRVWRRNGKTQTWKRTPDAFRVPIKYGLYAYDSITDLSNSYWHLPSECRMERVKGKIIRRNDG